MELAHYIPIAKKLSWEYPFFSSGADEQDVYQMAMIAAWIAIRDETALPPAPNEGWGSRTHRRLEREVA